MFFLTPKRFSFNKREEDFANEPDPLRAYNDYLEEIETIGEIKDYHLILYSPTHSNKTTLAFSIFRLVWNLANKIEVDETNRKIELYKKEYEVLIKKNTVKNVR